MKRERLTAEAVKSKLEASFAENKYFHMISTDELTMAICALEKRVPNRPLRIKTPVFSKVKKGVCPECGNKVNDKQKCCSNCGQALDWEPAKICNFIVKHNTGNGHMFIEDTAKELVVKEGIGTFCPNCGKEYLSTTDGYCANCGQKVTWGD